MVGYLGLPAPICRPGTSHSPTRVSRRTPARGPRGIHRAGRLCRRSARTSGRWRSGRRSAPGCSGASRRRRARRPRWRSWRPFGECSQRPSETPDVSRPLSASRHAERCNRRTRLSSCPPLGSGGLASSANKLSWAAHWWWVWIKTAGV